MDYQLIQRSEPVGDTVLTVSCLENFDLAVDRMYAELDARGEGERLFELCPFFAKLWPAARALSRWLWRLGARLEGQRVLEVGCGLALPSMAAARLGARVTASDFHPEVPHFLTRNMAANALTDIQYAPGDWRRPGADLGQFDYVIGSDVLYERDHPRVLAQFIARHLAPGGRAVIADPGRAFMQAFETRMGELGFAGRVDAETVPDEDGAPKDVYVLSFTRTLS